MGKYVIDLRTDKDLGSEQFIRSLLLAWSSSSQLDARLRAEFFDLGEPIRRSIAEEGLETAVQEWLSAGMALMLRRQEIPAYVASIDWRREKGLDPRPFPWSCTVWLDDIAGDTLADQFLRFLIAHFDPTFARVSTYDDDREKHFVVYQDGKAKAEEFLGLDVGKTLPGIYWITYFGPWAVHKVGRALLDSLPAHNVEPIDGGYLVRAYDSASDAGSPTAQEAERQIIEHLGRHHFFDKASVDIESLKTDPFTAALAEAKIKEKKAKRTKQP